MMNAKQPVLLLAIFLVGLMAGWLIIQTGEKTVKTDNKSEREALETFRVYCQENKECSRNLYYDLIKSYLQSTGNEQTMLFKSEIFITHTNLKQDITLFKTSEPSPLRKIAEVLETKCPTHLINYDDVVLVQTIVSTDPAETGHAKNLKVYVDPGHLRVICGYIMDAENDSYLLALD